MLEIYAKIIAHSRAPNGQTIVTWELQYPRLILAELNTHRQLSKNSSSSRAIPIQTIIDMVRTSPAMPVHWGKNQPGMQAHEELTGDLLAAVKRVWIESALDAARNAEIMAKYGAHKQVANRVLEPYQWMKTVLTGTCVDNFFWLRNHEDADPTIHALAKAMWESLKESKPADLKPGDWHVPYYDDGTWRASVYEDNTLEEALAISSSCCAQVSYRKLDDSLEKAELVYDRLVGSEPVHASPFEHQATPMTPSHTWEMDWYDKDFIWPKGVTHKDREGNYWSGNFKGWIQHRQLIPNNVCNNYKEPK